MAEMDIPVRGAIVTYLDPDATGDAPFRRGVANGTAIADPRTNEMWIPLADPADTDILVDWALVVEVVPPMPRAS